MQPTKDETVNDRVYNTECISDNNQLNQRMGNCCHDYYCLCRFSLEGSSARRKRPTGNEVGNVLGDAGYNNVVIRQMFVEQE